MSRSALSLPRPTFDAFTMTRRYDLRRSMAAGSGEWARLIAALFFRRTS